MTPHHQRQLTPTFQRGKPPYEGVHERNAKMAEMRESSIREKLK